MAADAQNAVCANDALAASWPTPLSEAVQRADLGVRRDHAQRAVAGPSATGEKVTVSSTVPPPGTVPAAGETE